MYIERKKGNAMQFLSVKTPSYSIGTRLFYMIQFIAC